jgi:hypothetical protein
MLAKIEAKYAAEYAAALEVVKANYLTMLDMALQQSADAALMAADDTWDVNAYSAEKFHIGHIEYMNKISHMAIVEDKDDDDMEWTKETVDRRLLQIVGKDNFAPWDERHGRERPSFVPADMYYDLLAKYNELLGTNAGGDSDGSD